MTDTAGFVIEGDDKNNKLSVTSVLEDNGDRSIYNEIQAGDGNDQLDGTTFTDPLVSVAYGVELFGEDGNDTLLDTELQDTLSGGAGNDYITSTGGHDIIDGGEGRDTLAILGPATLSSKKLELSGVEILSLDSYTKIKDFDLGQFDFIIPVVDSIAPSLKFAGPTNITGVVFKNATWFLTGSSFNDTFDVSTSGSEFHIFGRDGNDNITGGPRQDWLEGGDGDDTLTGGRGSDHFLGGNGNDIIFGGDDQDWITEDIGNNTIYGGGGNDIMVLLDGKDLVIGGAGADVIHLEQGVVRGGQGNDRIVIGVRERDESAIVSGGAGDDEFTYANTRRHGSLTLHGGDGDDTLNLSGNGDFSKLHADGIENVSLSTSTMIIGANTLDSFGRIVYRAADPLTIKLSSGGSVTWKSDSQVNQNDSLIGSHHSDHIDFSNASDTWFIDGRGGDDVIIGGLQTGGLVGGQGNDTLVGHGMLEGLFGKQGNDTLVGYGRDDTLRGGDGQDMLFAGAGLTKMTGNAGKDTFVFANGVGVAVVYDFQHSEDVHDQLDFSGVSAIKGYSDLISNHVKMIDDGHVLLITYGTSEIGLLGVTVHDLDKSAFIF